MKKAYLLLMIICSIACFGQRNYYTKKTDKEALKSAYRILKAFYPDEQLCVSDSIFDLEWWGYRCYLDAETSNKLYQFRIDKNFVYNEPVRRKGLSKMLNADSLTTDGNSFYADFSQPYENMIRCDIMPIDRLIGIRGEPRIDTFLFRYDKDGNITQVTKSVAHID